jgi:hypothetical protein
MTISIYLQGGLGNQLFQYAAAKALAEYYQCNLILDCSWFKYPPPGVTKRNLDLDFLNISCKQMQSQVPSKRKNKIALLLSSFLPFGPIVKIERNAFYFNKSLLNLNGLNKRDLALIGYWQSYKYFEKIRPLLQNEFRVLPSVDAFYQPKLDKIRSTESVMLHIRRGDYVSSPSAAKMHGALGIKYYLSAIDLILEKVINPHFFVFSDDLPWAKEALPKNLNISFVENSLKLDAAAQELQLMRECKHHIIANSSLSWWGAWLKNDPDGLVLAPNRWISDKNLDLSDLLPPNWQRLPA